MAKSKKAKASKPKGDKKAKKGGSKSKDGKKKGSKKKGKKQPLSKRDMELAKIRIEKEEQERLKREADEKAAIEKKLAIEMAMRAGHLVQSVAIIQTYDKWVIGKISRRKTLQEWNTFKACRNLPDFSKLYQVNSYLAYWLNQLEPPLMKKLLRLSPEFLQMVNEMQEFLLVPPDNIRLDLIRELGLLYRDMVDYQHVYLNKCTYAIMEDMSDLFDPEVGVCDYLLSIPEITHCLWGNLFACPDINEHEFQELQFKFKIPETLLTARGIYRLVKTEYDHFSDSCLSYFAPGVQNALRQSILDWIEKHALDSGDITELQSPEDEKKSKILQPKSKSKGKKKKKKRKGSKKRHKSGKKGKRRKSGSTSANTDYEDMDEETRKFMKEMENENSKSNKEQKKKKKAKKGKKGKKTAKGDTTDYSTGYTTTDTEEGEEEDHEEDEGEDNQTERKKDHAKKVVTEADLAHSNSNETKEEKRARRRREAEEADEVDFDFSTAKVGGTAAQDETNLYDDDDDNNPAGQKKRKDNDGSDSDESKRAKPKKKEDFDKKAKHTKSKSQKEKSTDDAKKLKSSSSVAISKKEVEVGEEMKPGRKSVSTRKPSRDEDQERKRSSAMEEEIEMKSNRSKRKVKSKSKNKLKSTKSLSKKSNKRLKGTSSGKTATGSAKAKKALSVARSKIRQEAKAAKIKKGKKSKAQIKNKKDENEVEKVKKSKSKVQKVKSKTDSSKSRGRSTVKRGESGKKSPGVSKSKSKSGSRGRSTTPKGKSASKSRSKSGSKGRKSKSKSKSRSRSGSKKGKKKGKKGKKGLAKSKSRERPKTEAELAKERERAEKAKFIPQLHDHELNLRNYNILGGVYTFNLLEVPPQPRTRGHWAIHLKEPDTALKDLAFEADYAPPTPQDQESAKKTPEEMEKEAKRQEEELQKLVLVDMAPSMVPSVHFGSLDEAAEDPEDEAMRLQKMQQEMEAEYEAEKERRFNQLLTIEVTAPKIALWFEPPTPVRWDSSKRIWSTDGFFDIKFNENSLQLSFRTVRFGIMGFGHNRWSNLPYQSWELKPLGKDKVLFSLIAAMAVVEFIVMGDLICVSSLQNVTNSEEVEKAILNKYMKPKLLIKAMIFHGLDLFPEIDSYAYVDGVLVKHFEAEDHLYQCMALVSSAFNFQWSRWNLLAGRDKMVFQMRERHGTSTPGNYSMVLTTPRKAIRINCTEVSPNYTEEPVVDFEYYADVLNLVRAVGTDHGLRVINQANPHHVEAVRVLLTSLRPLSFS